MKCCKPRGPRRFAMGTEGMTSNLGSILDAALSILSLRIIHNHKEAWLCQDWRIGNSFRASTNLCQLAVKWPIPFSWGEAPRFCKYYSQEIVKLMNQCWWFGGYSSSTGLILYFLMFFSLNKHHFLLNSPCILPKAAMHELKTNTFNLVSKHPYSIAIV